MLLRIKRLFKQKFIIALTLSCFLVALGVVFGLLNQTGSGTNSSNVVANGDPIDEANFALDSFHCNLDPALVDSVVDCSGAIDVNLTEPLNTMRLGLVSGSLADCVFVGRDFQCDSISTPITEGADVSLIGVFGTGSEFNIGEVIDIVNPFTYNTSLSVIEGGNYYDFFVSMNTDPGASEVAVHVSTDDQTLIFGESDSTILFNTFNWNVPQKISIQAANDAVSEDDHFSTIEFDTSSANNLFDSLNLPDLTIDITDNDTPGILLSDSSVSMYEDGSYRNIGVKLASQPEPGTVVQLSYQLDAAELGTGTLPSELVFDEHDWFEEKVFNLIGQDDFVDQDQAATVTFSVDTMNTTDSQYASGVVASSDLEVLLINDEEAGIIVDKDQISTLEGGSSEIVKIWLQSQPRSGESVTLTATVLGTEVEISNNDTAYGSTNTIIFDDSAWGRQDAYELYIRSVNDSNSDGPLADMVTITNTSSSDSSSPYHPSNNSISKTIDVATSDNESASVYVVGTNNLSVDEAGNQNSMITVGITTIPTGGDQVQVDIAFDGSQISLNGSQTGSQSVVFSNSVQSITYPILAVDDNITESDVINGIHTSHVTTSIGSGTSDISYTGMVNTPQTQVAILDNDAPGVIVDNFSDGQGGSLSSPYSVNEDGGVITFDVTLASIPGSTIYAESIHGSDFVDSPDTALFPLEFDQTNWDVPQTVTLTAQDNNYTQSPVIPHFVTTHNVSNPLEYRLNSASDNITIVDDDAAGLVVRQLDTLENEDNLNVVDENSSSNIDKLGYSLASEPSSEVVVYFETVDEYLGFGPSASSLYSITFSPTNWNVEHIVEVHAANDDIDRGSTYTSEIYVSAYSDDYNYDSLSALNQAYLINDNDEVGVIAQRYNQTNTTPDTANIISENDTGIADFLRLALSSEPLNPVTVSVIYDADQVVLGGSDQLLFDQDNWNIAQPVEVFPIDDVVAESDPHVTSISFAVASADAAYNILSVPFEDFLIDENDGFVFDQDELFLAENGVTSSVGVKLTSEPQASQEVKVLISASEAGQVTSAPTEIIFDSTNWDTFQPVTVFTVDDADIGDQQITLDFSVDSLYPLRDPDFDQYLASFQITLIDNETTRYIASSYDTTIEENGGPETVSVALTQEPDSDVTINLSPADTSEIVLSDSSLLFPVQEWDTPRTFTIFSVDDGVVRDDDTSVNLSVDSASDPVYAAMADQTIQIAILNDDKPDILVSSFVPLNSQISESEGVFMVDVVLSHEPEDSVYVWAGEEVSSRFEITPAQSSQSIGGCNPNGLNCRYHLVFTASNWNQPQTIMFTAQDNIVDANDFVHNFILTSNLPLSPENYRLNSTSYGFVINDDDGAGVVIASDGGAVSVGEDGSSDIINIALDSEPTDEVTLSIVANNQVTVNELGSDTLTFDSANWNQAQTVSVTAVNDTVIEGNHTGIISFGVTSGDALYNSLVISDSIVAISDNESAGFVLDTFNVEVGETNNSATVGVTLTAQPLSDVIINFASSDETVATVSPSTLTITPSLWDTPSSNQITISGINNNQIGDGAVSVVASVDGQSDDAFVALPDQAISVNVLDDDTVGVIITETGGSTIAIEGASSIDTYRVVLSAQPTSDVNVIINPSEQIKLNSAIPGQPIQLTFTPQNWDVNQIVSVEAVDDDEQEGNQTEIIEHTINTSDINFSGLVIADVQVSITDNEVPGVLVTSNDNITQEDGDVANVFFMLSSQPSTDVQIPVLLDNANEGSLGGVAQITISPENWNNPTSNFVVVKGVDDQIDDGDVNYTLLTGAPISSDSSYASLTSGDVPDFGLINEDDDEAGVTLTLLDSITSESGDAGEFSVVLDSVPSAPVQVLFTSSNIEEGRVQSAIQIGVDEWDQPQSIIVTGVDDELNDDNQIYSIITNDVVSNDAIYDALEGPDVIDIELTNEDNESVQVIVTSTAQQTSEGGQTATVSFELSKQPANNADVVIPLSIDNPGEGDIIPVAVSSEFFEVSAHAFSSYELVIKNSNWNNPAANSVTIVGNNDTQIDGAQSFRLITGNPISDDTEFDIINADAIADLVFTNEDNDVDTDNDCNSDEQEVLDGTDSNNVNSFLDTDGDEVPDAQEVLEGTDPNDPDSYLDNDNDGSPNCVEIREGTDPNDSTSFLDTDGDGFNNFQERQQGSETPFSNETSNGTVLTPRTGGLIFVPLGILAGVAVFYGWKIVKRRFR